MGRREFLVVGSTLLLVALSLVVGMFYPGMSVSQKKPPKASVPAHGSIRAYGVGVYWDPACTNSVVSIDWGVVTAGSSVNRTVYVRNLGNSAVSLGMSTLNWVPSNSSSYFGFVWDYAGQPLTASGVVEVTFTLSISQGIQGVANFSFDTVISTV